MSPLFSRGHNWPQLVITPGKQNPGATPSWRPSVRPASSPPNSAAPGRASGHRVHLPRLPRSPRKRRQMQVVTRRRPRSGWGGAGSGPPAEVAAWEPAFPLWELAGLCTSMVRVLRDSIWGSKVSRGARRSRGPSSVSGMLSYPFTPVCTWQH